MKKFLLAAVAAATLIAGPAFAETSVGIVNVAKIMRDSKAAVSVSNQMKAKQKTFQAEVDAKGKDLHTEDQALVKAKDTMDKDAFEKKVKDFQGRAADEQRKVQEKKDQVEKAFAASLEDIQKNLAEISKQVATERKITVVISSAQVIYGDPALDMTDEVLKRLDAKLPSVTVKF